MADFFKYVQTDRGVFGTPIRSFDSDKAVNSAGEVYIPAADQQPTDLDTLKISETSPGTFELVAMDQTEKDAQDQRIEDAEVAEVEANVTRPDPQVDVLGAVVLEEVNKLRAALKGLGVADMEPLTLANLKQRARQIARQARRQQRQGARAPGGQ